MIKIDEISFGNGKIYFAFSEDDAYPANGGLRVMTYRSEDDARKEAIGLATRMIRKHNNYHTGFSGGKIVAAVPDLHPHTLDAVIEGVSTYLNGLDGRFLTGCDLNFGEKEVTRLSHTCSHILAALDSGVHYAEATAAGVIGAVRAAMTQRHLRQPRVLVHGCGAVGARVATRLATEMPVATFDLISSRAELPHCQNISGTDWTQESCEVLVLVSASRIIDVEQMQRLSPKAVVCGANIPFIDDETETEVRRQALLIDEGVASAGAVIADSIEYYARDRWQTISPDLVYQFIEQQVYKLSMGQKEKALTQRQQFIGQMI